MTYPLQSPRLAMLLTAHASLTRRESPARLEQTNAPVFTLAPTPATAESQLEPEPYRVRRGDTLTHIARQHLRAGGTDPTAAAVHAEVQRIAQQNGLRDPNLLQPGQQLRLGSESTSALAKSLPGASAPKPLAAAGSSRMERVLPAQDLLRELRSSRLSLEEERRATPPDSQGGPVEPVASPAKRVSRIEELVERMRDSVQALKASPWGPVLGSEGRLSSSYGMRRDPFNGQPRFHHGIDLAAPVGTPISAPRGGTVSFSGWRSGYGNLVELRHDDGTVTRYGHNAKNLVARGERVDAGAAIATVGSTGRSTGPHVHFEVRRDGRSVNPMPFLQSAQVQVAAHSR